MISYFIYIDAKDVRFRAHIYHKFEKSYLFLDDAIELFL